MNIREDKRLKVIVVCSANSGQIAPFVSEQIEAIRASGVNVIIFPINQKGIRGYLKLRNHLSKAIFDERPNLIHAHYGLSGVLANLQSDVRVVTTYHGCDINKRSLRMLSWFSLLRSKYNIFVSVAQLEKVKLVAGLFSVVPCGINLTAFYPVEKKLARAALGWDYDRKYVLFSSSFDRPEKNASLAFKVMDLLPEYELVELVNMSRKEVLLAMNAADVGLLTSIREGSPMFVKELLACKRPIVSTPVGDVAQQLDGINGCFVVPFNENMIAECVRQASEFMQIEVPQDRYTDMDSVSIATKIINIYHKVLND